MGIIRMRKELYFLLGALLLLLLLPALLHANSRIMNLLILSFIWGVTASAWNLIIGYARILSFGQIAFFAIGAYTSAMMAEHLGISPWVGMLAGGIVAAVVGILIALPCLRLRGIFIALVTYAIHMILPPVILWGKEWTGGTWGCSIPPLQLGGYSFSYYEIVPFYYVALVLFALLLFVIYKVIHSSVGLAFVALRDAVPFAKSLGISEYKYKLMVFGISSLITGVIGAFYTQYYTYVSPAILGLETFFLVLIMVLVGGFGRFPGAVIAAFFITFADDFLRPIGVFRFVILGAIVIVIMICIPQGLMGIPKLVSRFISRTFRRRYWKQAS